LRHNDPSELKPGDSVAVSGVCRPLSLSAAKSFPRPCGRDHEAHIAGQPEARIAGKPELPGGAQDRMVGTSSGHVDGTAQIVSLEQIKGREDWRLVIDIPPALARYVVSQGSITVEGISLTWRGQRLPMEIAIIPHTLQPQPALVMPGIPVNLEVDVLAKYAEKMAKAKAAAKLTVEELMKQGFSFLRRFTTDNTD